MTNIQKCAIIGCGFVGATISYSLMKSEMFSKIVLIDLDRKKAEGEADDMNHGLPFNAPMEIYAGDYCDLAHASIIIITAGANQKPHETRLDLVRKNNNIFQSIIKKITKYNKRGIIIVVTNPVDILTYATIAYSGFPKHRIIGSGTVLDTARLKYLVGRHLEIDSRNVHTFIIGEHGDSELAVWSSANISGIDLDSYCKGSPKGCDMATLNSIFEDVKTSAYKIISAKNATYYAIAESVKKIASAIVRDEHTILPVSTLVDGHYGIEGVCMGLPCIVGRRGIEQVLEIPLNEDEESKLRASARALKSVIDQLEVKI